MINVLIVEDDLDHCDLIRDSLNSADPDEFRVVYAHSVADGKRLLQEREFSCVILDHSLPDGLGAELLENSKGRLAGTPVIGLSTSRDPAVAILDFRSGCVEFLQKHEVFRDGTLRERVKAALDMFKRLKASGAVESFGIAKLVDEIESVVAASTVRLGPAFMDRAEFEVATAKLHTQAQARGEPYTLCLIGLQEPTQERDEDKTAEQADDGRIDELMALVATIVTRSISDSDLVTRASLTQFLLFRGRARADHTLPWAQSLAEQISRSEFMQSNDPSGASRPCMLAVCIAVAGYETLIPTSMQQLIDRVNRAVQDRVAGSHCWVVLA